MIILMDGKTLTIKKLNSLPLKRWLGK